MKKFIEKLTEVEGFVASLFIGLMTILVIVDVAMREVFKSGLPWAQKAAVYLMIWAGFLGAILVSHSAAHLRPEIADKIWKKYPFGFVRLQNTVILIFSLFFFYASFNYVQETLNFGDKSIALKIPLWILQAVIPYSFFSICLRHLYFIVHPQEQLNQKKEFN
jgi:TRAP-type C4-dicarboxylate transport system permease small subunit